MNKILIFVVSLAVFWCRTVTADASLNTVSGTTTLGAAPSSSTTNSGTLTANILIGDGARGVVNGAASGAVPVNADGSTTTFAQVNALAPGFVETNNNVNSFVIFTNNGVSLSVNASGILTLTNYAAANLGFAWSTNGLGTNTGWVITPASSTTDAFQMGSGSGGFKVRNGSGFFFSLGRSDGSGAANGIRLSGLGDMTVDGFGNFKTTVTATNGFSSYARNLLAPIAITVGSSPFNWTNSSASAGGGTNNVTVFVDGVSVTGTVGINGTTIFNTIGQCTVPLQPGEWTTITYTIGTPTATCKPR